MKSALNKKFALLIIDIIIIIICVAGYYLIIQKPNLPFNLTADNGHLFITNVNESSTGIDNGSILLSIDNYEFNNWEEVELYLDGKRIGDNVNIQIKFDNHIKSATVYLTNFYNLFDLIIIAIVGMIFIGMAMFVRIRSPENYSARLFHWASIGLGIVIVNTAGVYHLGIFGYGYLNRMIWLFAYSFTPVIFIHFTSTFAKKKVKRIKYILWYFYTSALVNALILCYLFLETALGWNFDYGRYYVRFFDSIFRLFLIVCILVAISVCIYAYRTAKEIEERKRLQWLLLGFFIGPFSFIVFWVIPKILTGESLIPEAVMVISLTAIPITFGIAIVKYHLMDVNLIARRSLYYAVILSIIIVLYIGLSSLITFFVHNSNTAVPSIITAIVVVIALQPLRTGIQKFVDKKFFRVEYDFREEQRKFLDDIKSSVDIQSLAGIIVTKVNSLIPVDNIGFFILSQPDNKIKMIANKGWDLLKGRSIRFETENLKSTLALPVAVDDKVEHGLNVESADVKVFKRWGMVLVFPVKSPTGTVHAFLALGSKKSGSKYFKDDIDLLNTVAAASALAIDRIKLQEELILEKLEAERLDELNKMKSFFVSTVSHDLKTPLTSIKIFTELLQSKLSVQDEKSDYYLKIIEAESDKLRRLIDNILDFTKIEKGLKSYDLKKVNLTEIICKVVNDLQYQAAMAKQKIIFKETGSNYFIKADPLAVERAVINLLTNAIKYSEENATTYVSIISENEFVGVQVKDKGKGISNEQQEKIFNPFFRSDKESSLKAEGTGLGLTIVKHIIDAHKGKIEVKSEIGKGSIFTIWFQTIREE